MQYPVHVLNTNTKRDQGKKAQLGNIQAAKVRPVAWHAAMEAPHPPRALSAWRLFPACTPMHRYRCGNPVCADRGGYHSHDSGAAFHAEDVVGRLWG